MVLQAIPDHHQRAGVVSLKMPQEDNDVGSVDRMIEVPLVDPPRQCQGDRRRYLMTFTDLAKKARERCTDESQVPSIVMTASRRVQLGARRGRSGHRLRGMLMDAR